MANQADWLPGCLAAKRSRPHMSTNNAAMATWSTAKAGKEVASGEQAQTQTKRN